MGINSFLELLLNEKNIAGAWAVIGALIALLGIFINNFFENRRKRKERHLTMIKDGYVDAIEYISHMQKSVSLIAQDDDSKKSDVDSSKFYKLFLVASPQIISSFIKTSAMYERTIMRAAKKKLEVTLHRIEYESARKQVDMMLNRMTDLNIQMKEYNDKKGDNPAYWNNLQNFFDNAQKSFELHQKESSIAQRKRSIAHFSLVEMCTKGLQEASPLAYDTVLNMRDDIDRKLKKKDREKIRTLANNALEQQTMDIKNFLDSVRQKIEELEKEENAKDRKE